MDTGDDHPREHERRRAAGVDRGPRRVHQRRWALCDLPAFELDPHQRGRRDVRRVRGRAATAASLRGPLNGVTEGDGHHAGLLRSDAEHVRPLPDLPVVRERPRRSRHQQRGRRVRAADPRGAAAGRHRPARSAASCASASPRLAPKRAAAPASTRRTRRSPATRAPRCTSPGSRTSWLATPTAWWTPSSAPASSATASATSSRARLPGYTAFADAVRPRSLQQRRAHRSPIPTATARRTSRSARPGR